MRLLVAEDDPKLLKSLVHIFESNKFSVDGVANGGDALTYALLFAQFGDVYLPTSYGSLFAIFLLGAALIALGIFLSSLTDNQGLAAGVGIAVILFNYYSVSLSEYVSSTAFGSMVAIIVLIVVLYFVIRYLTKNEVLAYGVCFVLAAVVCVVGWTDASKFEGLLPDIMRALSLFDRFSAFVSGVFDLTAIVYYLCLHRRRERIPGPERPHGRL